MKSVFVLAIMSFLMMVRSCQSSCEEIQEPMSSDLQIKQDISSVNTLPRAFLKRFYDGMNYDGFVGLMGKRTAGSNELPPEKRDMHDFFVGLMGRRNTENGNPVPLKRETFPGSRGTIFPNKCKMRFRRFV
ncbi:tachykinin-3b isoform X1 [Polyodon spathula]|uniref:tachykinin-3b isoform X1 n=1 Tax=Polyodon spathula TaxID=7913 RepID=UPI001B7E1D38|nr:tachykinin-3b isoform X1 [Polyodon spathula]